MDIKTWLYDWNGVNVALFQRINALHYGEYYDKAMLLGSALGNHKMFYLYFPLLLVLSGVMIWHEHLHHKGNYVHYRRDWTRVLMVLIIGYGFDGIITMGLKDLFHLPRPFVILPEGSFRLIAPPMEEKEHYISFPSGHAVFSMLLAVALWPVLNGFTQFLAVIYVLWVGLSRIALAQHFPADVLAGYAISVVVVTTVRRAVDWAHLCVIEWELQKQKAR